MSRLIQAVFYVLVLGLIPCVSVNQHHWLSEKYKYEQDADIIIGGVVTVNFEMVEKALNVMDVQSMMCICPIANNYKKLLTFLFAIEEINKDQYILPNVTLGYHIYDSCGSPKKAIKNMMQILSGTNITIPNYTCTGHGKLAGVIGDLSTDTSLSIAQVLGVYGYTQVSYGATGTVLSDRILYPSFFRMLQDDRVHYDAISKLLKHFGWTWIGVIVSDEESGDKEIQELIKQTTKHGICIEYISKINKNSTEKWPELSDKLQKSTSSVVVLCGAPTSYFMYALYGASKIISSKILIIQPSWAFNKNIIGIANGKIFNNSLVLEVPILNIPGMESFLNNISPSSRPGDPLLEDLWILTFKCLSNNTLKNYFYQNLYQTKLPNCTGNERIPFMQADTSYLVYNAVYAMAHALHNMRLSLAKYAPGKYSHDYKHQLQNYLKKVHFKNAINQEILFDNNGHMNLIYHIVNWITFTNGSFMDNKVGWFNAFYPENERLTIESSRIIWKDNKTPQSQCSDNCHPGFRKALILGKTTCCYDCVPCAEAEISNKTDSENCQKCSDYEWPNEKKDQCIPKVIEFLSYTNDSLSIMFLFLLVSFAIITAFILGIFICFLGSPIVKANNQNLSFLLLVSIMLSYLCVFLFIGHPMDITCMLRQISFGIIFSVAVSCVLAKTIMVAVAFKATKPGSNWRKWVGIKLSYSVVLISSSIQVIICVSWLGISPPFLEMNMHSDPGKIIAQCNEGSGFAFYSVLGYMGLLAAVSFIIAFYTRKLPDSFNEAKFITFSMLVFCSVWIAMIPAYLSTKGKQMVAVEIFAILASNTGLLGCIFIPKCYIILFRPEMNTKTHLLGKIQK